MSNGKAIVRWVMLLWIAGGQIHACVCGPYPSVKQAWEQSPIVLSGYVELAIPKTEIAPQIAAVRTEESFKGSRKGQRFVLLQPGHGCAPKFKTGQRVLLYLNRVSSIGLWEAFGCGRTTWLETAADDLRFLRALPGSAGRTRFAGVVALYENSVSEGFRPVQSLAGIRVHLRSDTLSIEAVTADDGLYEVYDLPPGSYRVRSDVPKGLTIHFPTIAGGEGRRSRWEDLRATEPVVEIGARTAAHVNFLLMIDNQISGRVLDSTGSPMKDVCVELRPATAVASQNFYVSDCSEADGSYLLKDMAPGPYLITAKPTVNGRSQRLELFYPGTAERTSAKVVTIGSGEHLTGFDIRVPK